MNLDFILYLIACLANLVKRAALGLPSNRKPRYIIAVFHSFTITAINWPSTAMRCTQPGVADNRSVFYTIQSHGAIQCSYQFYAVKRIRGHAGHAVSSDVLIGRRAIVAFLYLKRCYYCANIEQLKCILINTYRCFETSP